VSPSSRSAPSSFSASSRRRVALREELLRRVEQPPDRQLASLLRALGAEPSVTAIGRGKKRETIVKAAIALAERAAPPGTTTSWSLAKTHEGIERAGLVIVNVREDRERLEAERMLIEIARIRASEEVRTAVLGRLAHRTPVTALIANLAEPKDPGTKKALARIKRVFARKSGLG
jgi:hypothetical protein